VKRPADRRGGGGRLFRHDPALRGVDAWKGGWPDTWQYKYWNQTNAGVNFTVYYGYQGSILQYSHGMRDQVDSLNDHIYQDSW
jgi:hypothetical protein